MRAPRRIPGYLSGVRRMMGGRVAIVMYHGVIEEPSPVYNWCQIERCEFERQIDFLATEYIVMPLDEVVQRIHRSAPLPRRAACVTFDDGFRNVATTAFLVLEAYRIPSTVFLVTSLVGTDQPAWPDQLFHAVAASGATLVEFDGRRWPLRTASQRARAFQVLCGRLIRMERGRKDDAFGRIVQQLGPIPAIGPDSSMATMGWDEVERLAGTGLMSFGSHTHTHQILSRCDAETQEAELRASRDILRERLGSADLFAYPNGSRDDFSQATSRLLGRLGYRCGLTTVPGLNATGSDPYKLRRVNVGADVSMSRFELLMAGL
jgi:peptidoglycan/xylan/chitin deacetylase (PgdA/CDA1 family)